MSLRRGAVTGCLLAGSAFLLVGCSSNNSSQASPTTKPSTSSTIPGTTTIPYVASKNARKDVTTTGCAQVNGSWVLKGTVKNSASTARTYQIVVDYVTQPGDTVLDTKIVTTSSVNPGATANWSSTGANNKTSVACIVRQVQAPAP